MPLSYPAAGFKDETEFNKWLRSRIRGRGFQCIHVKEADIPGPLDLVVWKERDLVGWFELKIDDETVRPSQKEFMREVMKEGVRSYVIRFRNTEERFYIEKYIPAANNFHTYFSTTEDSAMLGYILRPHWAE